MNDVTLNVKISNIEQLECLQRFLMNCKFEFEIISSVPVEIYSPESTAFIYTPNAEFKHFCGGEMLNHRGLISEKSAIDYIISYAKANSLYFNTYIKLDSVLQAALLCGDSDMKLKNLSKYITTNLFTKK